jgi:hypothetical protein
MAGVVQKLTARRKSAAKASQDARRALDELRALIARLRDERAEIERRPVPVEEAQAAAAEGVQAAAARIVADLNLSSLMRPADGRAPSLTLNAEARSALAFASAAPEIAQMIGARLAEDYRANNLTGIADDDRAAQLARIDADALAAEMAEEAVIRSMEAEGLPILRRPDAAPRALLAADTELR